MLSAIMEDRYAHNADEIAKQLDARYNQSKAGIQAKIDELREENEKEIQAQASITPQAPAPDESDANAPQTDEQPDSADEGASDSTDAVGNSEAEAPATEEAPEEKEQEKSEE